MYVRIYSNGDLRADIGSADEFYAFQKSLRELLKEDEILDRYLFRIIKDKKVKIAFETLLLRVKKHLDKRLLFETTEAKSFLKIDNYTDRAVTALALYTVLNTYGELR